MRIARVVSLLVGVLTAALVIAPAATAEEPLRLQTQITDSSGVLSSTEIAQVQGSFDALYNAKRIRIWVVYVNNFVSDAGQPVSGQQWAQTTAAVNNFGENDLLLAVAPMLREYGYAVQDSYIDQAQLENVLRNRVEPALGEGNWAQAPIALAEGMNASDSPSGGSEGGGVSWVAMLIILAVIVLVVVALVLWTRSRRRKRRAAELEAAKRVDPTDPAALAAVSVDALDDLSKEIVVDVDNAVRTSEGELALAVEEFGNDRTKPFTDALNAAKATLAQAFNARQVLDDAVPETPEQRRDLLTQVVVAAAKADRELDRQSDAFDELRNLVINAPTLLDGLTQQMVDATARLEPSAQTLARLHGQFSETALAAVAGNVDAARERVSFADQSITTARSLVSKPAHDQTGLVDAVRTAESALGQARTLLDAVDSASSDINRAIAALPEAIADTQRGIDAAASQGATSQAEQLAKAREAAVKAVSDAQSNGSADPLGTFTRLTKADADLDRLLASVAEERQNAERLARQLEQALFTAGSRVKAVSDFIDTRRGSVGAEARTRLAEATRQLEAANAKRQSNAGEAIAHANGASTLAAQAQQLANDDVQASQRHYSSQYGNSGGSDMGAMIGGIIIGNILRGGMNSSHSGNWGAGRGMGRPTSYGGASRSSGRSYSGGGRF